MIKRRFLLFLLLLLPVLFSGLSWELWTLEYAETEKAASSENALNRLIEISGQLSILNERLRNELQDSRRSSRELQNMLETSKKELDGLRRELESLTLELETLRSSSTELLSKAENSQKELDGLQAALRKAESSLMSLELSFSTYNEAAERKITSLTKENRLWKLGCIAAGVLTAGFAAAFIIGR